MNVTLRETVVDDFMQWSGLYVSSESFLKNNHNENWGSFLMEKHSPISLCLLMFFMCPNCTVFMIEPMTGNVYFNVKISDPRASLMKQ